MSEPVQALLHQSRTLQWTADRARRERVLRNLGSLLRWRTDPAIAGELVRWAVTDPELAVQRVAVEELRRSLRNGGRDGLESLVQEELASWESDQHASRETALAAFRLRLALFPISPSRRDLRTALRRLALGRRSGLEERGSAWRRLRRSLVRGLIAGLLAGFAVALLLLGFEAAEPGALVLLWLVGAGLSALLATAISAGAVGVTRYLDRGLGLAWEAGWAAVAGGAVIAGLAGLWGLLDVVLGGPSWASVTVGAWLVPGAAFAAAAARLGAAGAAGLTRRRRQAAARREEGWRTLADRWLQGLVAGLAAAAAWSLLLLWLRHWMDGPALAGAVGAWLIGLPAWLGAGAGLAGVETGVPVRRAWRRAAVLAVVVGGPVLVWLSFAGERRGSVSTVAEITAGGDQQRTGRLAFSDLPSEYGFALELPHHVRFEVPEEVEGNQDLLLRLYGEPRRPDSGVGTGPLPLVGDDPPEIEAELNPGHYRLLVGEYGRVPPLDEEEDGRWRELVEGYFTMALQVTGAPSPSLARIVAGGQEETAAAPGRATPAGDRWLEVTLRVDTARALREAVPLWLRAKDVEELGRAVSPLVEASRQLPEAEGAGGEEGEPGQRSQAGATAREEWVRVLDSVCRGGSLLSEGSADAFARACDRAVELAPGNPAVLESAAIQRALQGDRASAIARLKEAVAVEDSLAVRGTSQTLARDWLATLQRNSDPFRTEVKARLLEELPGRDPLALEQALVQKRREAAYRDLAAVPQPAQPETERREQLEEAVERFNGLPPPSADELPAHWTFACWALSLRAETDELRERAEELCWSAVEAAIGFSELNFEVLALEGQALASLAAGNREAAAIESLERAARYAQLYPPPFEGLGSERRQRYLLVLQGPEPRNPLTEEERRALLGQLSKWQLFPREEVSSAAGR